MTYKRNEVIQGCDSLFRTSKGSIKVTNQFFGPVEDKRDLEYWEDRLDDLNVKYCIVLDRMSNYSIYCDTIALYQMKQFS